MTRQNFFKGKKVLVTGHTGFVGSWLTLWLNKISAAETMGFSLKEPVSDPDLYSILSLKTKEVRGDIRDAEMVNKLIKDFQPDVILHLAAQTILLESYNDPVYTYTTNVIGTLNLLEAERKFGKAKSILNITTDKVYQNDAPTTYRETDKLGGFDPYSSSKACSELITQSYRNSFFSGIGVASARAGNILGGGDFGMHRIVPDLVSPKSNVVIRNPDSVRPFTFILDVLDGYMKLSEKLYERPREYSDAWNFSSDYLKKVIELVDEFKKSYPVVYKIERDPNQKHEDNFLYLDSTKAKMKLGWKPKLTFGETIMQTADWYKSYLKGKKNDMLSYSESQIRSYEARN